MGAVTYRHVHGGNTVSDRAVDAAGTVLSPRIPASASTTFLSQTVMDPAGLVVLAGRSEDPAGRNARCVLTGPSPAVRSLLGHKSRRRTGRRGRDTDAAWLTAHWR